MCNDFINTRIPLTDKLISLKNKNYLNNIACLTSIVIMVTISWTTFDGLVWDIRNHGSSRPNSRALIQNRLMLTYQVTQMFQLSSKMAVITTLINTGSTTSRCWVTRLRKLTLRRCTLILWSNPSCPRSLRR